MGFKKMTMVLNTTEMKKVLEWRGFDIPAYASCISELITNFCKYLSTRLNPELSSEEFLLCVELVFNDIKVGKSEYDHLPLPARLPGYPPFMYMMLRKIFFENIFTQVCDNEEFVKEVLVVKKEIEAEVAALRNQ